ncbi:DUF2254 domain-containing protein [Chryseobacterium scophthalmum]|uniref:DUF2254 domain-containing protein n=1 Tax=Chryseobacterium scophthalmum TaxID=59733 RepID=UPI00398AA516
MKKLLFFWSELKSTFWFVPVIIIVGAIFFAILILSVDGNLALQNEGIRRFFFIGSSASARSVLSTISGAMIGVAGTVFSVTLVALTLASSQFGPRLIRNFMYVRLNQVVLGTYISTYIYCLIVLNTIKDTEDYKFIPSLSILFAILFAVMNIVLLIIFIHRIAISIQADHVISEISASIGKEVKKLFPETLDDEQKEAILPDLEKEIAIYGKQISIPATQYGYMQYIDIDTLLKLATESKGLIKLNYRPGNYIVKGIDLGTLYYHDIEDDVLEKIQKQFILGSSRTSRQDIELSIHQMVEIAIRALSPGVNDPYTAISCIDNLTATLCYLSTKKFPPSYRFDDKENLRVITNAYDFELVTDVAFNQIRLYSFGNTAVVIKLMDALVLIHKMVKKPKYKDAAKKHARKVLNVGTECITDEEDLKILNIKAKAILG